MHAYQYYTNRIHTYVNGAYSVGIMQIDCESWNESDALFLFGRVLGIKTSSRVFGFFELYRCWSELSATLTIHELFDRCYRLFWSYMFSTLLSLLLDIVNFPNVPTKNFR